MTAAQNERSAVSAEVEAACDALIIARNEIGFSIRFDHMRAALEAAASTRPADADQAEVDRLRRALIDTGRNIGAGLSDSVSTDFLMHLPEEARLKIERLTRERDLARAAAEDYDRDCIDMRYQRDAAEADAAKVREENERLRAELRKVERRGRSRGGHSICPSCGGLMDAGEYGFPKPPIGHASDCTLASALADRSTRQDGADPAPDGEVRL